MTSLDDTIISYQNLMLLDNMTNYSKPAIDYFHHKFNDASLEMPASWTLLLKMRKHKLLRLPSCSSEDALDYNMYLVRLHHCLWRRWSIDHYGLQNSKSNPLSINWNKETDVTVLYGPDLTNIDSVEDKMWAVQDQVDQKQPKDLKSALKKNTECWIEEEVDEVSTSIESNGALVKLEDISCASSVDSHTSSIFDQRSTCTKVSSIDEDAEGFEHEKKVEFPRKLKFNQAVMKREIDSKGLIRESLVNINDIQHSRHHRHHHRHHHHHHQQSPRADERIKEAHSEFDSYTFSAIEEDIFYRNQVVF
ncbi:uncharacterized protein SPAR_K02780 [Saccharomyces paradoxus]|uniref:YKR075C-like protein n=1 Tax=Saccharomyces paradoxus TaxID=27291 RepID=A0A8B8UVE8_SACPA|nr:uncharacterized protein SPAR_K02780 [Saccharomyces paradoxus]QHS74661.1 hypothetical protein SPAR_K02780 [Saccharomyces paradoxus]